MASSLSSVLCSFPFQNLNPKTAPKFVQFALKSDSNPPLPPRSRPSTDKKSLAVATGEIFLGLAALLIRTTGKKEGEEVVKVVEDEEEDVVWEQREKDVEAEKERWKVTSPGFSFSAAGLLFPYHLGVAQFLIEKGYIKETTPLAGSSAGAIVCAVIASGNSMQEALDATKILAEDCRLKGTAFRLELLDLQLCSEIVCALMGGLTLFMPPTSASKTVRVCAFPLNGLELRGIGISPDCNPGNRATPRQLFNWALEPADDQVLDKLFELGYLDAAVWADQNPIELLLADEVNPSS